MNEPSTVHQCLAVLALCLLAGCGAAAAWLFCASKLGKDSDRSADGEKGRE